MHGLSGYAELPLHEGGVPKWLIDRMLRLAGAVLTVLVDEYGQAELLRRIADPLWFQALSNCLGFDWHSSGSTTVTCAILREALSRRDLGISAVGGKGRRALDVPNELRSLGARYGFSNEVVEELIRSSRLAAKVDGAALQDGYSIYHHLMVVDEGGNWALIQQGMNVKSMTARRYHWLSEGMESFALEPHKGILGVRHYGVLNLVAKESSGCRGAILDLVGEGAGRARRLYREALRMVGAGAVNPRAEPKIPYYIPPPESSVNWKAIERAMGISLENFEGLLLIRGIGPATLRALALISELIYEAPPSMNDPVSVEYDPVKWSFTFGGKDGVPHAVNRRIMDEAIGFLESALLMASMGDRERICALRRLSEFARSLRIRR